MQLREHKHINIDLTKFFEECQKKYKNVFLHQIGNELFIYRTIGRKEFTEIYLDKSLSNEEREEKICSNCVLYPKNFDYANCDSAGLPTEIAGKIIENSYISEENREKILNYYRNQMFDIDNQINCLIIAAFPNLTLEEVEKWDVITASKYLSRAEWILNKVKGVRFTQKDPNSTYAYTKSNTKTEEIGNDSIESTAAKSDIDHTGKIKQRKLNLTPQKLAELKAKYPMIPWEDDAGLQGIDGLLNQPTIDTRPAALRTPSEL